MSIAIIIGLSLLTWVAYDLWVGEVWLHRAFYRSQEPFAYWVLMLLWLGVAISCFFWEF